MTRTDNPAHLGLHVFERAGLGKAPFRFVGYSRETWCAFPGAPEQPGTSCDYCGQGIMNVCRVRDAAGKTFKVGPDCVAKTGDAGLIKGFKQSPELRAARRAQTKVKDDAVTAEFTAMVADPAVLSLFAQRTHDLPAWKGGAEPWLDWVKRCFSMSGTSGRARWLKTLKREVANGS